MKHRSFFVCATFFVLQCFPCDCIFLILPPVPEDVSTGLAAVYGFTPRFLTGQDQRVGFGFRFGNHADFQILYELGPQTLTKPLQPLRIRSASYRQRVVRRRPFIELLLRTGLLKDTSYRFDVVHDGGLCCDDEPR